MTPITTREELDLVCPMIDGRNEVRSVVSIFGLACDLRLRVFEGGHVAMTGVFGGVDIVDDRDSPIFEVGP